MNAFVCLFVNKNRLLLLSLLRMYVERGNRQIRINYGTRYHRTSQRQVAVFISIFNVARQGHFGSNVFFLYFLVQRQRWAHKILPIGNLCVSLPWSTIFKRISFCAQSKIAQNNYGNRSAFFGAFVRVVRCVCVFVWVLLLLCLNSHNFLFAFVLFVCTLRFGVGDLLLLCLDFAFWSKKI